ncbi:hypothetical protein O9992_27630 [Vibrio lentus]|nr:hypothetical protein [Vibrio lentus]
MTHAVNDIETNSRTSSKLSPMTNWKSTSSAKVVEFQGIID